MDHLAQGSVASRNKRVSGGDSEEAKPGRLETWKAARVL